MAAPASRQSASTRAGTLSRMPAWDLFTAEPTDHTTDCGRCAHARQAHEHYRAGSDCALCPCGSYASSLGTRIRRMLRR